MNYSTNKLLIFRWAARILDILFAIFLSLFSLDVFSEEMNFWNRVVALSMHLLPSFILGVVLYFSWNREWVGGVVLPILGILYLIIGWENMHWTAHLMIALPLFVIGFLFGVSWFLKKQTI